MKVKVISRSADDFTRERSNDLQVIYSTVFLFWVSYELQSFFFFLLGFRFSEFVFCLLVFFLEEGVP